VQLGARPAAPPPADDLAAALRGAATQLGHRPAVTVLRPSRREEQGYASLAQWAAKGAHWCQLEHLLAPGDRLRVEGPPGWLPVAVCLGAWWAGVTVVVGAGDATVAVVHEDARPPVGCEVVRYGDAVDGSPSRPLAQEAYPVAVQTFPDRPPPPEAAPDAPALVVAGRVWTQSELVAAARELSPGEEVVGLDVAAPPERWVPALAVRPLVTGRATVLVDGVDRAAAAGERVVTWL
jgi:uncharacterized protein (TIGR03089 family)